MGAIASLWCIPCAMDGENGSLATVQHVLDESGNRLGHDYTYGGCTWHHLGEPPSHMTMADCAARFGPSLEHEMRRYEEVYAPESILISIMNRVLWSKASMESSGTYMTEEVFGQIVRQEASVLMGRAVTITR